MEQWDVYNRAGEKTGVTKTRADIWGDDEYHLGVSLWLVNKDAQVCVQKRAATKRMFPNIWCNVCGSAIAGETSEAACVRETLEEIGVTVREGQLTWIGRIIDQNNIYDNYAARNDFPVERFVIPADEVSEVQWVSMDEIEELFRMNLFLLDNLSDLDGLRKYICENVN